MNIRKSTIAVLIAAVFLIIVGVVNGQPGTVMAKAIKICLECIGIG